MDTPPPDQGIGHQVSRESTAFITDILTMSQKHFTHEVFLTHVVSLDLLDYLCPVHKKEVLRVDAFRDLLNKTCQQPTGAMTKEGTPLVVTPGQLVTSVSELARVWDWHRDKVRDFLNGLAERDVLTIDMHKKFMVLSFPYLADRISAYAPKADDKESADPTPSPDGASEDKGQKKEGSSVTQNVATATEVAATKEAKAGSQNDGEKREEGNASTARRGGYMQEDLFSGVDNSGTQQVPVNTNQKKAE